VGLRPLACWNCGFESHRRHECLSLVSVVCCQVEFSASGRSLIQRSPTDCGVSECDRVTSQRRPWPTRACPAIRKKNRHQNFLSNKNFKDSIILEGDAVSFRRADSDVWKDSSSLILTLKMKALRCFETSRPIPPKDRASQTTNSAASVTPLRELRILHLEGSFPCSKQPAHAHKGRSIAMVTCKLEKLVSNVITVLTPENVYSAAEFTFPPTCVHKLKQRIYKTKYCCWYN
jgi:hypothetical protein